MPVNSVTLASSKLPKTSARLGGPSSNVLPPERLPKELCELRIAESNGAEDSSSCVEISGAAGWSGAASSSPKSSAMESDGTGLEGGAAGKSIAADFLGGSEERTSLSGSMRGGADGNEFARTVEEAAG